MGKIIGIDGLPADQEDITLKAAQWIMQVKMNLATDEISVEQDLGTLPPKNELEVKISDENNFSILCNAIAQMVGHLVTSGVSKEHCLTQIKKAIESGVMPAEDNWKSQGGVWKLYLVYQPTVGKMSIRRSTNNAPVANEKEAVNKDFYLLCRSMHTFIQHLISIDVPAQKLSQALFDVIEKYFMHGELDGKPKRIEITAPTAEENMKLEPLLIEATAFMKRLLPSHYACGKIKDGVRCVSEKGISEDNKDAEWENIKVAIRQKFGKRFSEVFHNVCADHSYFVVYLK